MHILYCHRLDEPVKDGTRCIAAVDVQLNDHIRLYSLRLLQMPDGAHRLYAPQAGKRRVATFSKPMAEHLTDLALKAWGEAQ